MNGGWGSGSQLVKLETADPNQWEFMDSELTAGDLAWDRIKLSECG